MKALRGALGGAETVQPLPVKLNDDDVVVVLPRGELQFVSELMEAVAAVVTRHGKAAAIRNTTRGYVISAVPVPDETAT